VIKKNPSKIIVFILFLTILIFGLNVYNDYGLGWDESACIKNGLINALEINKKLDYMIIPKQSADNIAQKAGESEKLPTLNNYKDRVYGSINEILITTPAVLFRLHNDSRSIILIRHLMIFLIFYVSLIYFYFFLRLNYSIFTSIFSTLILFLTPDIFADSFYNSKDIIFMSMYIISIYYGYRFIINPNKSLAITSALFAALLIDIRIPGIIFPFILIFFFLLLNFKKYSIKINIVNLLYFVIPLIFFVILFWPFLWEKPVGNFIFSFNAMKEFGWQPFMLFNGEIINAADLPWYYIPLNILVSTPLPNIALILFGFAILAITFKRNGKNKNLFDLYSLSLFVLPLFTVIALNSVLYNGWRQMYFIYPPIICLIAVGINYLEKNHAKVFYKNYFVILSFIILYLILIIFRYHPYQMTYTNILAGDKPQKKFETEYWGIVYAEALSKLNELKHKEKNVFKIYEEDFVPIKSSIRILSRELRDKFIFVKNIDSADFVVTNYSEFYQDYDLCIERFNLKKNQEIFKKVNENILLYSIFELDSTNFINQNTDNKIFGNMMKKYINEKENKK